MIQTFATRLARAAPALLVSVGVALRLCQFLEFRSLWMDEAVEGRTSEVDDDVAPPERKGR